jgi:hypothetical protein
LMSRLAVSWARGQFRPLRRGKLSLEPVQQPIDDFPLAIVERLSGVRFPEPGFPKHGRESDLRAAERAVQAAQKPLHPCCNIQRALLGLLQNRVVVVTFHTDLGRHAVEALRALFGTCQRNIRDRTGDAPVVPSLVHVTDRDQVNGEDIIGNFTLEVKNDSRPLFSPFVHVEVKTTRVPFCHGGEV